MYIQHWNNKNTYNNFFWKCRALFWGLESDGQRDADFCYQDETKHRSGKKCHSFHWRWTRGVHTQCCKDIPGTEKQQNWRRNCARVGKVSLCRLLQSEAFKRTDSTKLHNEAVSFQFQLMSLTLSMYSLMIILQENGLLIVRNYTQYMLQVPESCNKIKEKR